MKGKKQGSKEGSKEKGSKEVKEGKEKNYFDVLLFAQILTDVIT